jgi:hypothetical protein
MVDASMIITPPFTLQVLNRGHETNGIVALTRENTGSILFIKSSDVNESVIKADNQEERKNLASHTHLTKKVYGLFGMIKMVVGTYLIFIDDATVEGELLNA